MIGAPRGDDGHHFPFPETLPREGGDFPNGFGQQLVITVSVGWGVITPPGRCVIYFARVVAWDGLRPFRAYIRFVSVDPARWAGLLPARLQRFQTPERGNDREFLAPSGRAGGERCLSPSFFMPARHTSPHRSFGSTTPPANLRFGEGYLSFFGHPVRRDHSELPEP